MKTKAARITACICLASAFAGGSGAYRRQSAAQKQPQQQPNGAAVRGWSETEEQGFARARALYDAKDYAGARQAFERLEQTYPRSELLELSVLWRGRASLAVAAQEERSAADALKRLREADSPFADAFAQECAAAGVTATATATKP